MGDNDEIAMKFVADVEEAVEEVRHLADTTKDLADGARRAADGVAEMAGKARDTAAAVGDLRDHAAEAAEADKELRDSAEEAATALDRLRDKAVEAAVGLKAAGDEASGAGRKFREMIGAVDDKDAEGIFGNWFVNMFAGSKMQMIITGIMAGLAALPALIGGVGALAGIAFAGYFLDESGKLGSSLTSLVSTFKSVMTSAVAPLAGPIREALGSLAGFVKSIGPELKSMFAGLGPMVMPFAHAIEALVGGLLPGLSAMMKSAGPAVQVLAGFLGQVGKNLGSMFGAFATVMGPSSTALKAVLGLVSSLLPVISGLAQSMATSLAPVMTAVGAAFRAAAPFITIVGRILGSLAGAVLGNIAGGLQAVAGLVKATAPAFEKLASAVSQAFNLMENRGVLNDLEDSVEELVGPLSRLITALISGLVPALPAVISLLGSMADMLQAGMVTVITALANALSALISAIPPSDLKLIAEALMLWAVYAKALGPAKALIGGVGSAFGWVAAMPGKLAAFAESLAQGAEQVLMFGIRVVTQAAEAGAATAAWIAEHAVAAGEFVAQNVAMIVSATAAFVAENLATLGIIAGIALLITAIVFLALHWKTVWHDVEAAALAAWHFLDNDVLHPIEDGVMDLVHWVESHWRLLATILATVLLGPVGGLIVFIATHWAEFRRLTSELIDDVVRFFEGLPGRILGAVASFGGLLVSAGKDLVRGLINGVEDMSGDAVSAVSGLGGDLVHGAESILGIHSPSTVFAQLGNMITAGLALGINSTRQQAINESRTLAQLVSEAAMVGNITASQVASLRKKLATALGDALKGGVQDALATGTTKQIGQSTLKLLQTVWDAARGGDIDTAQASAMAAWVKADNTRLQDLAKQRNTIAAQIAAAKALATSTASSAESTYNLSSAAGSGSTPASVGSIISTLKADVGKIRQFGANIRKLAKEGLNKAYLSQLIGLGPDQGGAIAAELAAAGLGDIKSINSAEAQITSASNSLGQVAGNAMYDSGAQAGKGFLSGLKAQQSAIEKLMSSIAGSMVGQLRKDLGIASPSRVMSRTRSTRSRASSTGGRARSRNCSPWCTRRAAASLGRARGSSASGRRAGGAAAERRTSR